jgi:two-component system OmpR family response regulator
MNATPLRTVLYVDDDLDIREIVQIALELTQSLTVHTAPSGEQALTLARALRPDLVLLDVMMPGLDGPGTLRRMRDDPVTASIPVIFMTAKAMPKEVALFQEMGAIGVIAKPFDPLHLSTQVASLWQGLQEQSPSRVEVPDNSGLHRQVMTLGERFLQRTRDEAVRLSSLIEVIQAGDTTEFETLKNLAHRIRGSGATFGFAGVSECAAEIEQLADAFIGRDTTSGARLETKIERRLTECAQQLSREVEAAAAR